MSTRLYNAKGEFVDVPEDHPRFANYKAAFPLKEPPKTKPKGAGEGANPTTATPPAGNP